MYRPRVFEEPPSAQRLDSPQHPGRFTSPRKLSPRSSLTTRWKRLRVGKDNGNWRHESHVHLYGRTLGAKRQPWGHALRFPPTKEAFMNAMGDLVPLRADDIADLRTEIVRLLATDKYRNF